MNKEIKIIEEEMNDIQNFINFLNEVFNDDENFELNDYCDAYIDAMENPDLPDLMDNVPYIGNSHTNVFVEDELIKLKNNFPDKKLPEEFYSALDDAGYCFKEGTDWDYGSYVISKGNKKVLVDLPSIHQDFINFLNEFFTNDENFKLAKHSDFYSFAMRHQDIPELMKYVPAYATDTAMKLIEDELKKVKNNSVDKELPEEFYSALENAGYNFKNGVGIGYNYCLIGKNNKKLLIFY